MSANAEHQRQREGGRQDRRGGLPANLREWLDEQTLLSWALRVVSDLGFDRAAAPRPTTGTDVPGATILALVTYCYAVGCFDSEEIEFESRTNPTLRLLCGGDFVESETIRNFRRHHLDSIRLCLRELLRRIHQRHRWTEDRGREPWETAQDCPSEAAAELEVSGSVIERLETAIQADSMALDV